MTKRILAIVCLAALIAVSALAVPMSAQEKTKVIVMHSAQFRHGEALDCWFNGCTRYDDAGWDRTYEVWLEPQWQHPEIEVEIITTPGGTREPAITAIIGGEPIALVEGWIEDTSGYISEGIAADLTPFFRTDSSIRLEDFWPQAIDLTSRDGRVYGLPQMIPSGLWLTYNRERFDARGIAHPDTSWTPDSLREASRRFVHDSTGDGLPNQWGIDLDRSQWIPDAFGAQILSDDFNRVIATDSKMVEALEWIQTVVFEDGSGIRGHERNRFGLERRPFREGDTAMYLEDTHGLFSLNLREIVGRIPMEDGHMGAIPAPFPEGGKFRTMNWIMNAQLNERQQWAAWEVLKAMSSVQWQMDFVVNPIRNIPVLRSDEMREAMLAKGADLYGGVNAAPADKDLIWNITFNTRIFPEQLVTFTTEAQSIVSQAVNSIRNAQEPMPISSVLQEAADRANQLLPQEPWAGGR